MKFEEVFLVVIAILTGVLVGWMVRYYTFTCEPIELNLSYLICNKNGTLSGSYCILE